MAVLRDVKWAPSQHEGLQTYYDGFETWFRCTECEYCNTRLYHARMHYLRIHVEGGRPCKKKRKFVPDPKKPTSTVKPAVTRAAKPTFQTTLPAFLPSTKPRRMAKRSRNTKPQKPAARESDAPVTDITDVAYASLDAVYSPLLSPIDMPTDDFSGSFGSLSSLFSSPVHANARASSRSASPFSAPEFPDGDVFGGLMPVSPGCDNNDASDSEAHHGLWVDPPPPPSPRERRPERGNGRIHCAHIMQTVFVFGHYDMLRCLDETECGEEPEQ